MIVAVTGFYVLDFSLNAVQACCRSLILDVFPMTQQDTANAMASNLSNITNVIGYFTGYVDLVKYFPALGDSQMKVYCVAGVLVFILAMSVTCLSVTEVPYQPDDPERKPMHVTCYEIMARGASFFVLTLMYQPMASVTGAHLAIPTASAELCAETLQCSVFCLDGMVSVPVLQVGC